MDTGYRIRDQYLTYFVTFTVVGWVDLFTRRQCRDIIIASLKYCQDKKGLIIYAYVVMESHVHLILSARDDSTGLSAIIRDFKKFTSRELYNWIEGNPKESRRDWLKIIFEYHAKFNANNTHFQIWQQHNRPQLCLQPRFLQQKLDYIHRNPVKAGIVDDPADFVYNSARNYANRKDYILDVKVLEFGFDIGGIGF
ncbi:MAG: transposase [Saprospiraceae bacterium]